MSLASSAAQRTVLYEEHRDAGARFVDYAGWRMPISFSGVVDEHRCVRQGVGLFDVSHMGRFVFSGAEALPQLDRLVVSDIRALGVGEAKYTCCCNEDGGILDDVIVYRLQDEQALLVCNASNASKIWSHCERHLDGSISRQDVTVGTALVAVQGPRALSLLQDVLGGVELERSLPPFHIGSYTVDGAPEPLRVARTGYTGEDGCEIMLPASFAVDLWRKLLEKGAPSSAKPIGLAARDTLRLEARLSLYGNEIDETTNPIEAGLKWLVQFGEHDFLGREALERIAAQPLRRRLVGLEMTDRAIARAGYPVHSVDGEELGRCTSGAPAPSLGKNIALAYLPVSHAKVGTPVAVDCRGRMAGAKVVKTPFYRRQASR